RKWSVNADSAGNIYTRKVTFLFSAMLAQGSSLTLSNFGVRKGGTPIPMNDFEVRDGSGQDIKAGTWRAGVNNRFIVVSFRNDLIAAAGQIGPVLTLYATVGEMLQPGDVLMIEFDKSVANHFSTGFLSGDQVMEGGLIGPHLDSGQKPGGPFSRSAFLWSDGSDFNSGRHWITEARVESFSSKQVLVR
ncbi:MAG: hypothetical protein Q8R07_03380, partial [Candidatus Uhrbacteria bacterium]|nr:hypothetical protein [Candidatus Uhrbacteria bacterium]